MQIQVQAEKIFIKGDLTFNTVETVLKDSLRLFPNNDWLINLAEVNQVDSAALSLLCEWKRLAMQRKIKIAFEAVHQKLGNLMTMCGVKDLLLHEDTN